MYSMNNRETLNYIFILSLCSDDILRIGLKSILYRPLHYNKILLSLEKGISRFSQRQLCIQKSFSYLCQTQTKLKID